VSYNPIERCKDITKDYCYKVPKKDPKKKCYGPEYKSNDDETATKK
jgi:hypothetical protein